MLRHHSFLDFSGFPHRFLNYLDRCVYLPLDNWSANLLLDNLLRLGTYGLCLPVLLLDDVPVLLVDDGSVFLVDDLLEALVDDWLMNLVDLLLVNHRLVVLVDDLLMMLVHDVLVVLVDHVFVVLMYHIPMGLLHNWRTSVSLYTSLKLVSLHDSLLAVPLNHRCLLVSNDCRLDVLLLNSWLLHPGFHVSLLDHGRCLHLSHMHRSHLGNMRTLMRVCMDRRLFSHFGHNALLCACGVSLLLWNHLLLA